MNSSATKETLSSPQLKRNKTGRYKHMLAQFTILPEMKYLTSAIQTLILIVIRPPLTVPILFSAGQYCLANCMWQVENR